MEKKHISSYILFALVYACCILYITILCRNNSLIHTVRLIPFWSFADLLKGNWERGSSIVLNIILFIPFGYLLSVVINKTKTKKKICVVVLFTVMFSTTIEAIQFITYRGVCDFDDLISNTFGGWLGTALFFKYKIYKQNYKIQRAIPIIVIIIGLAGCFKAGISASKGDGTAYEKLFAFDITENQLDNKMVSADDSITLSGFCWIYERNDLPFQIILLGEESGNSYLAETDINGKDFTAKANIPGDEEYEVQVLFRGYHPISTSTFIDRNTVKYVKGVVPVPIVQEIEVKNIINNGILKVYEPSDEVYVYQLDGKLYWLIGRDIDENTVIIYHIHTNEPEKLPENRLPFGFDNRQFRIGSDKERGHAGRFRVFEAEIPTEYNVTAVVVGYSVSGRVTWKQHFRVNRF